MVPCLRARNCSRSVRPSEGQAGVDLASTPTGTRDRRMTLRIAATLLAAVAVTACGGGSAPHSSQVDSNEVAAARSLVAVTVAVPASMRSAPFNHRRTLKVPRGWHVTVWARVDGARLVAWTP